MAVEMLQIWYKNTPYRVSIQTKIQQNLMALGCLQVVFEKKTIYTFAYLIVHSENYFTIFPTKI